MINRIKENEERLDKINIIIKKLDESISEFKDNRNTINDLNKYYGSKEWFNDKEDLEKKKLNIKAGVLSEDAVWNMNENIRDLIFEMKNIILDYYSSNKTILLSNINKIHTTKMGVDRIKKNLNIDSDVIEYCKKIISDKNSIIYKNGKNWYCELDNIKLTINSSSYTIITANIIK